ncbi:dystrobrevin binding protein 1b isoform X1 [Lates japonicus]|uniref:Dystrobrevin binding protein 1b isoform X1 n=1 Tax=Lates japonicus TaxID=270547 RepID=A0AAD3REP1_LATJO|nr:dystrobrevin binding protein 1b isoform X1 [Lates japonicus]
MRKGQRESSSSESEESQQPWLKDSKEPPSPRGCSSDEDSPSDSDAEAESAMKRSQRFSSSFSFGEDQQLQSSNEAREEELSPKNSNGAPVTELVETELAAECVRLEKQDTYCDTNETPRSGLFRPQELWLAMTRCLSLRWPPCLSISRHSNRKLAYQVDLDQSEDTQSSLSSDSTNESSSSTSTSDDREVTLVKREEEVVRGRGVKSGPPPRRGVSRSSPGLPRARQTTDSVLASMILEKEMFLRIELVDSGEERDDLRYRAEWKLSERTKELAEGVWLSRSQKKKDGLTY